MKTKTRCAFFTALPFLFASITGSAIAADSSYYSEPLRPQYHFTPEKNWMNDPNGLVYYEGEYHLFYQYNPFGNQWGHMSWGHAVSPDMVHWKHLPLALPEADGVMIFSGSAVVDWHNSSGFGKNGKPPIVAIYTGYRPSDNLQFQCIAYSNDKGRTWTKYSGNPVIDINSRDFRDPKVQWHEPARRWIMTVSLSAEHKVRFYASTNLKQWVLLSEFGPAGATGGSWECPDLFRLPVAGTIASRWVLTVNTGSGSVAGGTGGQYFVGQFDGAHFVGDSNSLGKAPLWFDYGPDYYAAVSWGNIPRSDHRRLWLGWMSNGQYGQQVPTSPWRSEMSIPREVGLRQTIDGIRLTQNPVKELASLRGKHFQFKGGDIARANDWLVKNKIQGKQLELALEFPPQSSGIEGVKVLKGATEETLIGVDRDRGTVFVDRTHSGNVGFNPNFPGIYHAPLTSRDGKVKLRVFVDACSVEVFIDDGDKVFTVLVYPSAASRGVEFFGTPNAATIQLCQIWNLRSIWK
ncbi:MAG TPA: glycoside hydrolase family 32 protein [Verrucomicrobiae bacterium]|nr:glycoside hydrolase family 32 protein [Verrucomicrobiae bacterium]